MKHVHESLTRDTVIGEVLALPGDYGANDGLRRAAEFRGTGIHTFNSPFAAPDQFWQKIPTDKRVDTLAQWLTDLEVDILVSPTRLSRNHAHQDVGSIAMRAALSASRLTRHPIIVLEGRGIPGEYGRWTAATDGYPGLLIPAYAGELRTDITYTRHIIEPDGLLAGGSDELLLATGTI